MLPARLFLGLTLALSAVPCLAQEADGSADTSTGATVTEQEADTGALLLGRLAAVAEGGLALEAVAVPAKAAEAWNAEIERYAERATELRGRCHEELRSANRDTIVAKAGQCLRSDLLLEINHRRKQRDLFEATPGIDATVLGAATTGIDAFVSAATAVVDGVDAGVFTTLDVMKEAKRNLHHTYRAPMQAAFVRARSSRGLALVRSLASSVHAALDGEAPAFLEAFVPCTEAAAFEFATGSSTTGTAASLRAGATRLRECVGIADDAR